MLNYLGNAATNIILPLMTVQIAFGVMLSDGTSAFLSLQLGSGEHKKAAKGVANCITLTVIFGILLCALFEIFLEPLCFLFGSTENVHPHAMNYGRIIVAGFPVAMVNYAMAGVIRADGRPKESMIGMLIGCAANIILDYLFVIVFPWEVAGAAWATIIGQALNAFYYIYLMFGFICPITVAYAAPFTPISGQPSQPYIIIGSRTIFVTAPAICAIVEQTECPVACNSFSYTANIDIPKENTQHIRR